MIVTKIEIEDTIYLRDGTAINFLVVYTEDGRKFQTAISPVEEITEDTPCKELIA